jgi:hypothetical protein
MGMPKAQLGVWVCRRRSSWYGYAEGAAAILIQDLKFKIQNSRFKIVAYARNILNLEF